MGGAEGGPSNSIFRPSILAISVRLPSFGRQDAESWRGGGKFVKGVLGRLGGGERGFWGWGTDIRWSRDCAGRRAWGDLMGGGRNEASVLETAHLAARGGNSTRKEPGQRMGAPFQKINL